MNFIRRAKRSAQIYLILSGVGAAALVVAPVAAICTLLQPEKKRRKTRNEVSEHLKTKISEVSERVGDSFEEVAEGIGSAMNPDGGENWLREHRKLHQNVSDEEWEENNER